MIIEAIKKINPNAEVVIRGGDIDTCIIEWYNGTTPISKEDIKAMMPIVEQELKDAETQKETDASTGKQK